MSPHPPSSAKDPFALGDDRAAVFPLGLAIAAAIAVGLAPLFAVLNVQWGVAASADALRYAWIYANVALALTLTLVWPAAALSSARRSPRRADTLSWDLPAVALAALPALAFSAWLASAPPALIARSLAAQAGLAILILGVLSLRGDSPARHAALAAALAAFALLTPALAYLQADFARGSVAWSAVTPLFLVANAASHPGSTSDLTWWTAAAYAVLGSPLLLLSSPLLAPRPGPGPERADGMQQ